MHMILLVLDDPGKLEEVLAAWEQSGVPGATIIESTGIQRRRASTSRIPTRFTFGHPSGRLEESRYTLLTVVEDEEAVRRCLAATEAVVGDLSKPHTGILAAWPLSLVKGVGPRRQDEEAE